MSANNFYLKEQILRHINFFATQEVSAAGQKLYSARKVFFMDYNEKADSWKFTVYDFSQYQVMVKGVKSQNLVTSCTCPSVWGSVCAHTVAALLFVKDNLDNIFWLQAKQTTLPITTSGRHGKENGYELTNYQHLDIDYIRKNTTPFIFNQFHYRSVAGYYPRLEINPDSVMFISETSEDWVKIFKDDWKVYITSDESTGNSKLTFNEAKCLWTIAKSPMPGILGIIFNGEIQAKEEGWLKDFGLPKGTVFSEYFSFGFSEVRGLYFFPWEKGQGLVPLSLEDDHYLVQSIRKLNIANQILENLPKKMEQRELGFVLAKGFRGNMAFRGDFDEFSDDDYDDSFDSDDSWESCYSIIPIVGKTSKSAPTMFSTHITEYERKLDGKYIISKSENAEKLLKLIDEINDRNEPDFQLMKKAFEYLLREKFVFGLAKNATHIRKKDLVEIKLAPEPYDVIFDVTKDPDFLIMNMRVQTGTTTQKRKSPIKDPHEFYIFVTGKTYYFAKNEQVARAMATFPETLKMVGSFGDEFFRTIVEPVSKNFSVRFKKGTFEVKPVEMDFSKKQLFISERDDHVVFTPCVEYDNNVVAVLNTNGNILIKSLGLITEYRRNFEMEDEFLESISEMHPAFEKQKSAKIFYLHYAEFTKDMWFFRFFDRLQSLDVELFGLKELKNFRYSPFKGKINTSITSGQDWFEVAISVSFGDNRVSLSDIKKAVINKSRYIQLKDGSVGILPSEWFHKLEKFFRNGEIKKDKLEVSKLRFSIIDELFDQVDDQAILLEIEEKRNKLKSFTQIGETRVPKQIRAILRHYQAEGLNWLGFLDEMQWGGILADDMGLGKTLQVLAFLQLQANQKAGVSLVVVPTTLLFNWDNELKKFAPKLKVLFHYGTDRDKSNNDFGKYDLVITTYGVLVRDIEALSRYRFNYVVLDESQAIKNPVSHRYKAACLINARNRLALTGTPIENSTFDLFAQMSFVNRGLLGSIQKFKESYSNPIDKEGNEIIAGELNKVVKPFVLRRTKENVESELPEKTEDFIYCEMEPGQRRVYDAYRNEYRNRLLKKIEEEGLEKSKMMVLEALTRLRQICDSPQLLDSDEVTEKQSVKIKELIRHITLKTGRHKILVFSQFVKMLGLIRDELAKLDIEFEYLDGQSSSKQREQAVNNFQQNENLRVFLISLKAGGTGLNLTAADYVYLVDPWWNPAVENQAIDRCHRIGQDKKVFAYRMICTNTVEEKIIDLQNKKKKIAGDIIQTDESVFKKLDRNDITELFG